MKNNLSKEQKEEVKRFIFENALCQSLKYPDHPVWGVLPNIERTAEGDEENIMNPNELIEFFVDLSLDNMVDLIDRGEVPYITTKEEL